MYRSAIASFSLTAALAVLLAPAAARGESSMHVVENGDTLWSLARTHGCRVAQLQRHNRLATSAIRAGQTLSIPSCDASPAVANTASASAPAIAAVTVKTHTAQSHTVAAGDTLGALAKRYSSSVESIKAQNDLGSDLIRVGQTLSITAGVGSTSAVRAIKRIVGPLKGQSIGRPSRGKLASAVQLPHDAAYYRRRPERTYGTTQAVRHVYRAVRAVRKRYPKVHRLAIGDLSAVKGGRITLHNSHQSGRDVDLGFYFKRRPKGYPENFVVATDKNLDFDASWLLLTKLAATSDSGTGVERIFMTYSTQKIFYKMARKRGVSKDKLRDLMQYPRGRSAGGLIRHEPGHDEHIHVRFKCPPRDRKCS